MNILKISAQNIRKTRFWFKKMLMNVFGITVQSVSNNLQQTKNFGKQK